MQQDDKRKFLEVLTAMSELYDSPLSSVGIDIYWSAVKKYPLEKFLVAARVHTETSKWMPKPSDFVDAMNKSELSISERSNLAWLSVCNAVRSVGGNRGVRFDDPLIHAVVRSLGGWVSLCRGKQEYFNSTVRNAFIKTYEHMASCANNGNVLGTLSSLEPLRGAMDDMVVNIATGLPHGPQHKMLKEHTKERIEDNEKLRGIVHGVSEATKIGSTSRRSVGENVAGEKENGQAVKGLARNDRPENGKEDGAAGGTL